MRRTVRAGIAGVNGGWLECALTHATQARVQLSFAAVARPGERTVSRSSGAGSISTRPPTRSPNARRPAGRARLRLPGSIDAFELAVALCPRQHARRGGQDARSPPLERFGHRCDAVAEIDRAFPAPADLAHVAIERIAELGIIRSRAGAIQALAAQWDELAPLLAPGASPEALVERLRSLPGVGPWTAHYIAMRALGWPDAFPPGDVAALKAMRQLFGIDSDRAAAAHPRPWRPWVPTP